MCIYNSMPDHYQPPLNNTIVDETNAQLEEVLAHSLSNPEEVEAASSTLCQLAGVLQISDCAEVYQQLHASDMKQVDDYIRERPFLIETFGKARRRVLSALYTRHLNEREQAGGYMRDGISAGYKEAKTFIKGTVLDNDDAVRAQTAHLQLLHDISQRYRESDEYSSVPPALLEQLLQTEGELHFASDVNTYKEAVEAIRNIREAWGFNDDRSRREKVMSVHPASQGKKPTVIKIPSGHDAIHHSPAEEDDAALKSARALGQLPDHIRAIPRKPPRYH